MSPVAGERNENDSGDERLALAVAAATLAAVAGARDAFASNGPASLARACPAAGESAESTFTCEPASAPTAVGIGAGSLGGVIRAGGTAATRSARP